MKNRILKLIFPVTKWNNWASFTWTVTNLRYVDKIISMSSYWAQNVQNPMATKHNVTFMFLRMEWHNFRGIIFLHLKSLYRQKFHAQENSAWNLTMKTVMRKKWLILVDKRTVSNGQKFLIWVDVKDSCWN